MKHPSALLVVGSERAARAASFEAAFDSFQVMALDAWVGSLADQLDPRIGEASWLEQLVVAAQVVREHGGNPSAALSQEVAARLRRLEEAGLDPEAVRARLGKDRALASVPYIEHACALARALSRRQKRSRASSARTVAERLRTEPLFAQGLVLPERIVVRDVVRLTPALLKLFAELSRAMDQRGLRFEIELGLIERPLGGRERDALERIGDLYAEALDGPPSFRATPEQMLAPCTHHAEADPDHALIRCMYLLGQSLDAGIAADACGLAWPRALPDAGLRALGHAARGARAPVLSERRAGSARSVDELLRWCELLSGELRFDELLALLRSPLLELDVEEASSERRNAIRRLIAAPLPRGPAHVVLAAVADAESGQPGGHAYRALADLSARLVQAGTLQQSLAAIGTALGVLGLARGASRGGVAVFRAEHWTDPAERALLASIAFEERALSSFESVRSAWLAAARSMQTLEEPRGVADLARDLRSWMEAEAPRMAGSAASVRTGTLGTLAAEQVAHAILPDASFEAWSTPLSETVPALQAAERLAALGQQAEWLQLRMAAGRIDLITSSSDARGEPQRLHPMFGADATAGSDPVRLVLTQAERAARHGTDQHAALRIARQSARESWRGEEQALPDPTTGFLAAGLPWLASAGAPLSPHAAEQFVACAYRGFAAQELRARSESDADSVADPLEEGRILHELLEKAFRAAKEELSRPEPDPARVRELGGRAAREASEHLLSGIRKVQVQRLLDWVTRALDEASRDRVWRFDAAEVAFGPGHAWPAVEVDGTWYAGRIDRIDRSRAGAGQAIRVVDYKRSAVGGGKLLLQLPIYALAAERNDPQHGKAEQGVYLVPRRAWGSSGIRPVELRPSATEVVRASIVPSVLRLRDGDVAPRPNTPAECRTCAMRGVCRRPPFRVQEGP